MKLIREIEGNWVVKMFLKERGINLLSFLYDAKV